MNVVGEDHILVVNSEHRVDVFKRGDARKVKTLDIDTSDSIEVIKAFIDLKIGVESSQQRWAVMESEKIPSWLGRLGSTIYNMVGSVSDMVGIPIGKKTTFKRKLGETFAQNTKTNVKIRYLGEKKKLKSYIFFM